MHFRKVNLEKLMEKLADADYPFCEEVSKYEKLAKIGQGTFGYKAYFFKQIQLFKTTFYFLYLTNSFFFSEKCSKLDIEALGKLLL